MWSVLLLDWSGRATVGSKFPHLLSFLGAFDLTSHLTVDEAVCGSGPQGLVQHCMSKPWVLMYLFSVLFWEVWRQQGILPSFVKTLLLSKCAQFVHSPALVLCGRMFCFFIPTCSSHNCPFNACHQGHHSATPTLSAVSSAFTLNSLSSSPRSFPATTFSLVSSSSAPLAHHSLYWLVTVTLLEPAQPRSARCLPSCTVHSLVSESSWHCP